MDNENIPQSREEALLENLLGADNEMQPPQSRTEAILQNMLGANNVLEPPQSREEYLLQQILENGGGSGDVTLLNNKDISANGVYSASADDADGYKNVTVSVPNTYAAGDEGKVVSNGALVAQTAHATVTQNGTVDTTLNNSVEVAVPQPTGTKQISITQNGTTTENVAEYASAEITVNVSGGGGGTERGTFTQASAVASKTINHSLGTENVAIQVYLDSENYAALQALASSSEHRLISFANFAFRSSGAARTYRNGATSTSVANMSATSSSISLSGSIKFPAGITYNYVITTYEPEVNA